MANTPWMLMRNQPQMAEEQMLMAGIPGLGQMAHDGAPTESPQVVAPPNDQIAAAPTPAPAPAMPQTVAEPQASPGQQGQMQKYQNQLDEMREERLGVEQGGIDQYENKINEYESGSQRIDWRPLAGLLDQWAGGGNLLKVADSQAPEAPAIKKQKLQAMREKLQGMKSGLSATQYGAVKSNLDVLKSQMSQDAASKRLANSMQKAATTQGRLRDRDNDKDLMQLQKRVQPLEKVDNVLEEIEKELGFNFGDYDPLTGMVGGQPVNIPGVSTPVVGRLNLATAEGRRFQSKLQKLVNTILKERSGAAVTDQEMKRILDEFGTSKGKAYTESDILANLRSLVDIQQRDTQDIFTGFRGNVVETYLNPSDAAKNYKRRGGAAPAQSGMSPEKKARLEELRAKKARGEI